MAKDVSFDGASAEHETSAALAKSFELSPEYQCILGWDGTVHRINPAFSNAFDVSNADILGRQIAQLCHPDDRDAWHRQVTVTKAAGTSSRRFACRLRAGTGAHVPASWYVAADSERRLLYAFGRPAGPSIVAEPAFESDEGS